MDRLTEHCGSCGHPWGIGRFCVNCGQQRADAAPDRPAVAPPPLSHQAPQPARFPLFAGDPVPGTTPDAPYAGSADVPAGPAPAVDAPSDPDRVPGTSGRGAGWAGVAGWWWAAAAVVLVALVGLGGLSLLGGSGSDPEETATDPAAVATPAPSSPDTIDVPSPPSTAPDDPDGTDDPDETEPSDGETPTDPVDVAALASVTAPETAAPSRDVDGNAVRYDAANMLDGQPDTAWRMSGDGSGREIVLRLDSPTEIFGLGLINGYAKLDPGYDGYAANRRVTQVEWVLDDGTVIPQDLTEDRELQGVEVDGVVTETVTLRILAVTPPGSGRAGRDYTAVSDIAVLGSPR